ncbi:hypothetical protein GCM10014719_15990 [Planomonospora parontospora subsp. antibiotica]|nr:hypothetical protein GCM10014719_15990 [Planomonospora parontospora subsp. antibiotica]GII15874.1 hypothetical protein Ppa05_26000 [Planomonospora parontospora subsp. antibiotica]
MWCWDNVHLVREPDDFAVAGAEWLPAYAPEPNPAERVRPLLRRAAAGPVATHRS